MVARVGLMTRAPWPGLSMTRLAAVIGARQAAEFARAVLLDVSEPLAASDEWQTTLFVEPPSATGELAALTGITDVVPQEPGRIGARMSGVVSTLRGRGSGAVIVVGSDIALLGPTQIDAALRELGANDIVFGPARDGGYYLLALADGFGADLAPLFDDAAIPWSTDAVLSASFAVAEAEGWRVGTVELLTDVDTAADIVSLRAELNAEPDRARARRTREFLARLEEEGLG